MSISAKLLEVKDSTIPQSGKGLFVATDVAKGTIITEYMGRRTAWADVEDDVDNPYIYFIDEDNIIDASKSVNTFGRYANDAAGLSRIKGLKNNSEYFEENKRIYIKAIANISAGSEVFVSYGKDYWKQIRENNKIDTAAKKKATK